MTAQDDLVGKVVTLPLGRVVTVRARASAISWWVEGDKDGYRAEILDRVLRELPPTYRRATFVRPSPVRLD